jgi:hypothetical protein
MHCLVIVKFLPEGSLSPEEFFTRINARWQWLEDPNDIKSSKARFQGTKIAYKARSAICITDYESIEQLSLDVAIMPGAGISNVEVMPIFEQREHEHIFRDTLYSSKKVSMRG